MNNFDDIKVGDTVSFYPNKETSSCLFGYCERHNIKEYTALVIGRHYDIVAVLCDLPYIASSTIDSCFRKIFNMPEEIANKYNGEKFIGIKPAQISKFEIVSSGNIGSRVGIDEERGGLSFL